MILFNGTLAAQAPDGATLYRENCRVCHGPNGVSPSRAVQQYKNIKTLSDSSFLAARSDDSIVAVLTKGAGRDMKSFGDKLSKEQMLAIARYVRLLGQNKRRGP